MLDECPGTMTCNAGRCMSIECAVTWSNHRSFAGCFFYTAHAANVASDASEPMSFLITNPGTAEATVSLEHIDGSAGWVLSASANVPPGKSARLSIRGAQVVGSRRQRGRGLTAGQQRARDHRADRKRRQQRARAEHERHDVAARARPGSAPPCARVSAAVDARRSTRLPEALGGAARMLIVGTRPDTPVQFTAGRNGAVIINADPITMVAGDDDGTSCSMTATCSRCPAPATTTT